MSDPHDAHREQADAGAASRPIGFAVLTISDTRREADDLSGDLIVAQLREQGHEPCRRAIVRDEPVDIDATLRGWINDPSVQVALTTGGTGISRRDTTVEVVQRLIDTRLDGFGELFRMLSYEEVGAASMLSRAVAGLVVGVGGDTFIFAMPGSPKAVKLAMCRLILPEVRHLVQQRLD